MKTITLLCASALASLALTPAFATDGPYVGCLTPGGAINRVGLGMPLGGTCPTDHIEITVGGSGSGEKLQFTTVAEPAGAGLRAAIARCPDGEVVVGGGAQIALSEPSTAALTASYPSTVANGTTGAWFAFANPIGPTEVLTAYAICASLVND